jgi:hypothetical protein
MASIGGRKHLTDVDARKIRSEAGIDLAIADRV